MGADPDTPVMPGGPVTSDPGCGAAYIEAAKCGYGKWGTWEWTITTAESIEASETGTGAAVGTGRGTEEAIGAMTGLVSINDSWMKLKSVLKEKCVK